MMSRFYPVWAARCTTGGCVLSAEVETEKGTLRFAVLVNNAADAWYMIERMQHQLRKAWEVDQ